MSYSPFVMKVAFYQPSKKNKARNIAHIHYIATRPGADMGEINIGDSLDIDPGTAAGHAKYMGERPGSFGLFGPQDSVPSLKDVQDELKNHDGIVWRMVLSLKEEDAVKIGFTNRESWENILRVTIPEAANKMGIDESNLKWVAAFHQAQGHPHVHLVIWEKVPSRKRGVLSKGERKDIRKIFIREIYAEERLAITTEKSAIRDLIRKIAQKDIMDLVKDIQKAKLEVRVFTGQEPGLAPFLDTQASEELIKQLKELSGMMPGHGRAALKYMPPEVKDKAREIADWLLRQPGFLQSTERYKELAKQLAGHYTQRPENLDSASERAYKDIRDRVAQVVLKGAAVINRDERMAEIERVRLTNHVWRHTWRVLERERSRAEAQAKYASMIEAEKAEIKAKRNQMTDAAIDRL